MLRGFLFYISFVILFLEIFVYEYFSTFYGPLSYYPNKAFNWQYGTYFIQYTEETFIYSTLFYCIPGLLPAFMEAWNLFKHTSSRKHQVFTDVNHLSLSCEQFIINLCSEPSKN